MNSTNNPEEGHHERPVQNGGTSTTRDAAVGAQRPMHSRIPRSTSSLPDLNAVRRTYTSEIATPVGAPQGGGTMTPEERRLKWKKVIGTMIKDIKFKRLLDSWRRSTGSPCPRCAAMKLTEAKFLISDITKHQRDKRALDERSRLNPSEETLGQEGLDFGPNEYKLGSVEELRSRIQDCPFCRLAISSLRETCESYIQERPDENSAEREAKFYADNADVLCFASWQIDGRLLVRDPSGKIEPLKSKACTRRIRLRWSSPDLFDTYIVLMAPRTGGKGLFLGRPIDTVKTDAALIQRWVALCENSHGDFCKSRTTGIELSKSFFGVIDVKEMCLTKLPPKEKYIALSYTWGSRNMVRPFQTNKGNIRSLLVSGGLRKWRSDIPRTIRDAIDLVIDLGQRYLWVDSLCIIQDTDRSWALNSRVMDVVYGNAYLTICAADGDNSNAGLRGLHSSGLNSNERDLRQNIASYSREIRLMSTQPAENFIRNSAWNTRGWTFQERLLSVRNVIFVAGRMYFQCRCTARSCDIITEDESAGWSIEFKDSPLLMLQKLNHHPLSVYKKSLELYMTRKLTHPKDILAAFTGIGNLVCGALGGNLVFGLPSSHFDWALLWEPRDAAVRRPNEDKEEFPSWSWCGWKQEIMEYKAPMLAGCEDNLHDWLMYHTWITWYIRDGNGNLRLVWDGDEDRTETTTAESRWRGYMLPPNGDDKSHDKYGRLIKESERNPDKYPRSERFELILKECPYDVNIIGNVDTYARNSTEKDMPFLQFFTWRAFFRIREDLSSEIERNFSRYSIVDYKDDWCGTILLDKFWVRRLDLEEPLAFIAISDAKQFSDEEYNDWANYIPLERQESSWDLYYVLLVTYEDDIAYRQGLGKVFKDAFDNSCKPEGKQWKEHILG